MNWVSRCPLPHHDIHIKIFHCRIKHFFGDTRQAMDLIDKQNIPRLQLIQDRNQIPWFFDRRTAGRLDLDLHLVGDHHCHRCFP